MTETTIFAKRMRETREKKGLKQKELAEHIGVTPQTISAYEKNGKAPTLDNAIAIANTLGVSLDWLCGIDGGTSYQEKPKTLGDIARVLYEISRWIPVAYVYDDCNSQSFGSSVYPGILFPDSEIGPFLSDNIKMQELLYKNAFAQEFYDRWVADRIRSLNEISIKDYLASFPYYN